MQQKQDIILEELRKFREPVAIYLRNGIKLLGMIEAFDEEVVLLKGTVSQVVYKQVIATVSSAR